MLYRENRKAAPHPGSHDAQKAGQPVIVEVVQSASWGISARGGNRAWRSPLKEKGVVVQTMFGKKTDALLQKTGIVWRI